MRFLKYLRYLVFLVGLLLIFSSFYLEWNKFLIRYCGIVLTVAGGLSILWERLKREGV